MPNPPTIERIFLGLERPPLHSAAEIVIQRNLSADGAQPTTVDLSSWIFVLPSSKACRRLLQLLANAAGQRQAIFTPPQLITIGQLPEKLYTASKPLASELAQQIAWARALENASESTINRLINRQDSNPTSSSANSLQNWQPMARLLARLHTRLASDIWSFRSVAREVGKLKNFLAEELVRWEALEAIQADYYQILESVNLWDRQAARSFAAAGIRDDVQEQRCHTDHQILLIGVADLNRSLAGMLAQVAEQTTCMIAAEESMSDRFDAFGSLISKQWQDVRIPIDDEKIRIVDTPTDQAQAVGRYLANLKTEVATDEVSIGVPDASVIPQIERRLNLANLPCRNLAGRSFAETGPVKLVNACKEYLQAQDYRAYAAMVRHPDLHAWISNRVGDERWLIDLDEFQNNHLPNRLPIDQKSAFGDPEKRRNSFDAKDPNSKPRAELAAQRIELLNAVHGAIGELLIPLVGNLQPIGHWTRFWTDVLVAIYGGQALDPDQDRDTIESCTAIYQALSDQQQVPVEFGLMTTAAQAIEWAIDHVTERRLVSDGIPEAIEIAGWLDLPLDDAKVIAVTGMNDENVPTSENGHQFLPNALCEQLGILDNNRRYARDCYALTLLTGVRDEYLLVVGRRDEQGQPKKPSRLLFADSADVSAARAKSFFTYHGEVDTDLWLLGADQIPTSQQLPIPIPQCSQPPTQLSVTKFKEYLKCPYRFYLGIVMKLRESSDDWRELSGGTFGDLTHNVLEAFAESNLRDSKNAQHIFDFLQAELDEQARRTFQGSRLPAVRIQVEQLRNRFERFAHHQAAHRRRGWRIVSTEELLAHRLMVDGQPFTITGKIDRVDQHESTGQVAIWDYKSSDAGEGPFAAHYSSKKWKDLQLPLYRHLVKEVAAVKNANLQTVSLGYVLLSKKLDEIKFEPADFTPQQLQEADEVAFDCIRKIRAGVFWPPEPRPPKFAEHLSGICQDDVFEKFDIESNSPAGTIITPKDTVVELSW